jgi:hypothetical protein
VHYPCFSSDVIHGGEVGAHEVGEVAFAFGIGEDVVGEAAIVVRVELSELSATTTSGRRHWLSSESNTHRRLVKILVLGITSLTRPILGQSCPHAQEIGIASLEGCRETFYDGGNAQ